MGGLPEIIQDNVNGILCNPENMDSIKQTIMTLYNHPEILNKLMTQTKASVKEMTNINEVIDKYCSIIEKL